MAHFSTSYWAQSMRTSSSHQLRLLQGQRFFFVVTTTAIYVVSEWIKYELTLVPTSPIQPMPIRMIEWGPKLVTQTFALAAIVGTLTLLVRISCRLFRKPSDGSASTYLGRLSESVCSVALASMIYFLGVMSAFGLWRLNFWTLQMGIVVGVQRPLFSIWRFLTMRNAILD
jgi:hypothetical protein